MNQYKEDVGVPYYIFEEIVEYVELTAKGYCKSMKWENIKALLNLAVINNRISYGQAKYLKETFCRENAKVGVDF